MKRDRASEIRATKWINAAKERMTRAALETTRSGNNGVGLGKWWFMRRYAAALFCVVAAFLVRYWLNPILGNELPFMMFISAALMAAWYGGAATGIVALMLGLILADNFFTTSGAPTQSVQVFRLVRYLFTASLGIVLIEMLHRGRRKTEAAVRELKTEAARREAFAKALVEAHEQLCRLTSELEQRVAERTGELASTVSSLQDLLYQMAHHLRAPLRAVAGYLQIIKTDYTSMVSPQAELYFRNVFECVRRMDDLIGDLLEYGTLIHKDVPLTEVSLLEAVSHVLVQAQDIIRSRSTLVNVHEPLPKVRGNIELLERTLLALLDNATKFLPVTKRPRVTIWAEEVEDKTRLWVQDNGIGIDPRYRERVFGALERLHTSEEYEGNGIGLAIVRLAMQRMKGSCGVQSERGSGSCFWLEFERCEDRTPEVNDVGPGGDFAQGKGSRSERMAECISLSSKPWTNYAES